MTESIPSPCPLAPVHVHVPLSSHIRFLTGLCSTLLQAPDESLDALISSVCDGLLGPRPARLVVLTDAHTAEDVAHAEAAVEAALAGQPPQHQQVCLSVFSMGRNKMQGQEGRGRSTGRQG